MVALLLSVTLIGNPGQEYRPGPEKDSVVSVGLRLQEIDAAPLPAAEPREISGVQSLDGQWRVALDPQDTGKAQGWFSAEKAPNKWLALGAKGDQTGDFDWLYHKDVIAKPHPITAGLQTKIMTPDYYAEILAKTKFFRNVTPPDDAIAVAIHCTFTGSTFDFSEGVMLGTYQHHAGRFTLNTLSLLPDLGHPAADRLLLDLLAHAYSTAAPLQPLPSTHETQLTSLGIVD